MSGAFVTDVGVEALVDVDAEDLVASLTEGVTPAVETAEEVEHPQRVAASRLERLGAGERYRVWVSEDRSVLGLWRGGRRTNPPVSCRVTEGPWR